MAFDDYEVVVYKILVYLYECIKAGVPPSPEKAKELCNQTPDNLGYGNREDADILNDAGTSSGAAIILDPDAERT